MEGPRDVSEARSGAKVSLKGGFGKVNQVLWEPFGRSRAAKGCQGAPRVRRGGGGHAHAMPTRDVGGSYILVVEKKKVGRQKTGVNLMSRPKVLTR